MGRKKENQLLFSSINLAVISSFGFWLCLRLNAAKQTRWAVPTGIASVMGLIGSMISLHMRGLKPSDNHSWRRMLSQYARRSLLSILGPIGYRIYMRTSRDVRNVQEKLLLAILNRQKNTEYGKTWGFHSIKSREEFRHRHPLTDYSHYMEMMERAAQGEQNILTKDKVTYIALTSGTTGKNKKYLITDYMGPTSSLMLLLFAFGNLYLPFFKYLKRNLYFILPAPERKTEAGIPMGPVSARWSELNADSVCPGVTLKLTQEEEAYYAQAVFALADPELGSIQGFSSNLLYSFFKFIERHVDGMVYDIEMGKIGEGSPIKDIAIRAKLSAEMSPKPERAAQVKKEVALGSVNLARRLWSGMDLVTMAKNGGFAHCARILESSYLRGIHTLSTVHGSTEGWYGLNIDLEDSSKDVYTVMTGLTFFEFIRLDDVDKDEPRTYFLDEVKVGECYELVVSNYIGLYRFRIGDIIRIVGFQDDVPQYEFCYRLGQRLNLAFERTPELCVDHAVEYCGNHLPPGVSIVDYTSTESHVLESFTGEKYPENQYVFFLEVMKDGKEYQINQDQIELLDTHIRENHAPYDVYRKKGSIGPVKVIQVLSGAFEKLKHTLWNGTQSPQFKMPHVIRREVLLRTLLDNPCSF